jgi:hypothetical protein
MAQLPDSSLRLFPHHRPKHLAAAEVEALLIGRMLEEGETADLRWLAATVPEERLASWLGERGGRQLSRRSRAFWQVVLHRQAPEPPDIATCLWPL